MIHGVPAMLRHLRPKPLMKGHNEGRIRRGVSNLSAVRQGGISNVDLPEPGLQFSQPRHVVAVNSGRIGEDPGETCPLRAGDGIGSGRSAAHLMDL